MGLETATAVDGLDAVEVAEAAKAAGEAAGVPWAGLELVTMDMTMPRMNGLEATAAIRALGFTGLMVGCTGNAMAKDVNAFMQAGVDHVLAKPIDTGELFRVLSKRFGTRVLRQPDSRLA
jgi:CheY-like chemotaxis protein